MYGHVTLIIPIGYTLHNLFPLGYPLHHLFLLGVSQLMKHTLRWVGHYVKSKLLYQDRVIRLGSRSWILINKIPCRSLVSMSSGRQCHCFIDHEYVRTWRCTPLRRVTYIYPLRRCRIWHNHLLLLGRKRISQANRIGGTTLEILMNLHKRWTNISGKVILLTNHAWILGISLWFIVSRIRVLGLLGLFLNKIFSGLFFVFFPQDCLGIFNGMDCTKFSSKV